MSVWYLSHRADPRANQLAKRHYSCQSPESVQFVPPGRCVVLRTEDYGALWVVSHPFPEFTRHARRGGWVNSLFRRESGPLASDLIREAVAVTRWCWPIVPDLGLVTFVDTTQTRTKRDPGRCYLKAGFRPAACPEHAWLDLILDTCASCQSRTAGGLVAVQMLPADMPEPMPPAVWQTSMGLEAVS